MKSPAIINANTTIDEVFEVLKSELLKDFDKNLKIKHAILLLENDQEETIAVSMQRMLSKNMLWMLENAKYNLMAHVNSDTNNEECL